ncbi:MULTISPECIES: LacI family DNA-binding transcriptional regulator [unclassified Pseudomonas]|jgi:LacI family transcriptional regulator|uniref:LacI family DNA-binding transcriptional regulator n=1 Tax=unclassified Pseudomonas TaxID=196821 RepID=UPI000C87C6B4|nr:MULTISPECIES: LacI family DNA-binding transcriptional regulator [unclassified Pseudomonas]PMU08389.1 LacI family transcriptional regulator [Pseudomonas sp. FW305-20]PMU19236.1 LacI family transcriptional regulator [Pseudomonas sp. FW305-122]PMU35956.1 LacI family transcriptional regulator [Pseudomonas sp. FW305-47B]PMX60853.1 LacI family transcriptional regulator [Pseudomonas sp. FW305-33]PMX65412.1 LacI family transcriptional regulator [Pseudomonas sp. FW305-60]
MATIKDVAALAGISYTTVSHVVNKTRPVSEEVRVKVEAAIKTLDYVPSAVARSLKAKTTATIGLLVPNSLNPYFAELARGIEDYCERNGYCVILCNSDDNPDKQRSYLRVLLEKRIDGLIVASAGGDAGLAEGLAGVRTPMVIVDRGLEGVNADMVRIDHEYGAYLATRHLLELGHRDIATIGGPASTSVAQMRLAGYCRALKEAGVEVARERMLESDFTSTGGYNTAAILLENNPPSAIFAGNDMIGIGVLRAAAERNIRVPTELSVIGFDDIQMSRYVYPALTTVGQSILQLGEMAAEVLLRRIATPDMATDQRIVTPSIVLRESTAPLAGVFAQFR